MGSKHITFTFIYLNTLCDYIDSFAHKMSSRKESDSKLYIHIYNNVETFHSDKIIIKIERVGKVTLDVELEH